jgi:hypothetical protein
MDPAKAFDLDAIGQVILRPMTGYTVAPVAESAILARIEYVETQEQLKTGGKAIQLVMTPPQALALAEVLTRQANRILGLPIPNTKN